ncbi:MAG: methyltransferase domain-containing protein, partial [Alphaproteobacteria bacterium]|nr:methyltransferase domain-containing protein [Alphaproteobacteria bacterium]
MSPAADPNLAWWEERAALHPTSPMYAPLIDGLRRGEPALFPLERALVGDVAGQRLLHLQCHVGHDTLSWQLLGAEVTGVDFSPEALGQAARLATELGRPARWVRADVTALPRQLEDFDVVVATYGTTGWFGDLRGWAEGIARALRPGGRFVYVDGHPTVFGLDPEADRPVLRDPIGGSVRLETDSPGTYADPAARPAATRVVEHCHGVADLVGALLGAGLVIEHLGEHRGCPWQLHPRAVHDPATGLWDVPPDWPALPALLSIRAVRPGPAEAVDGQDVRPVRVLFLCSRARQRSPTAAGVWNREPGVEARAAGTASSARRRVRAADLAWADLVLVMESRHRQQIEERYPAACAEVPVHVLEIPDTFAFEDPELVAWVREAAAPRIEAARERLRRG